MKILIISDEYPPFRGGIATYARALTNQFAAMNHQVDVITHSCSKRFSEGSPGATQPGAVSVIRLRRPESRYLRAAYLLARWPTLIANHLRRHQYDRILIADPANALSMPRVQRMTPCDYDVVVYGSEVLRYAKRRWTKTMFLQSLNQAKTIYCITKFTSDLLAEFSQLSGHVTSCGAGENFFRRPANPQLQAELRQRHGLIPSHYLIGTIGRLDRRKGHDVVLESLAQVIKTAPNTHYLIGGCGPEKDSLIAQSRRLGLESHVTFTGEIAEEELVDHYDIIDLFVMPNRVTDTTIEGFGITFIEAAARGIPSIGVANGGVGEAIDSGRSGCLLSKCDAGELSQTLQNILTREIHFNELVIREHAAKFSWNRVANRFLHNGDLGQYNSLVPANVA